ncbi:MAG: bifunctional ornithine acetyltransferase/N-acetylglutamate synthase [Tissierellaceae bacterium]
MKFNINGILAAKGFKATGGHTGVKKNKKDMAIIYSQQPSVYAGAFTSNHIKAAPVIWDKDLLGQKSPIQAIVINSGNANAVTGKQGQEDTRTMAQTCAKELGLNANQVLVCSTGIIGQPLPMDKIVKGIEGLVAGLGDKREDGLDAAEAIMTTDSFIKEYGLTSEIGGVEVNMGSMGKGAGMIEPNMATLLGFVLTDVNISQEMLQKALIKGVNLTFNMITVDGDTSTNDSVILLANGLAGNPIIDKEGREYEQFFKMLLDSLKYLATSIVRDGEGATKFLEVNIKGARSFESGKKIAKSILTSNLVKTAFFGEDANWGRILAAMGYSGETFNIEKVNLDLESSGGIVNLLEGGRPLEFSEEKAKEILMETDIRIKLGLGEGQEEVTAWGCDLSYDYVKINGDYRS